MRVVLDCTSLLSVVKVPFLLRSLPLDEVFVVLSLEIAFEFAELSLDFILTILADHFDGAQAFLCLAQFVFLLLLWTSQLLNVNALVNTPTVSLTNSYVVLMPSIGASCGAACVHLSKSFTVYERIMTVTGIRRSLWVTKNRIIRIQL